MSNTSLRTLLCVFVVAAGCGQREPAQVLLFDGTGTSAGSVHALEEVLDSLGFPYSTADSAQLDAMSEPQLRAYRLFIVPGGNFEQIGNHLQPETSAKVRRAIAAGSNYLGICAGAFFAGDSPYNGLNLTGGVRFDFHALSHRGIRKAAVAISTPSSAPIDHYWEDGPQLSGWGAVAAKYPDGTAAVAQGFFGKGWVTLVATHPEAPDDWRIDGTVRQDVSASNAYAAELMTAALQGAPLPRY